MPDLVNALAFLGLDLRRMRAIGRLPRYLRERQAYTAGGGRIDASRPVLYDYNAASGGAQGHYFHQDLLVARLIHEARPDRHVDIGSRVGGFVAHVAAFRQIEVMDVRPLTVQGHPQISFVQADLMAPLRDEIVGAFDSVSCLHALEHFGLGRYGDPVNPRGHLAGFENLLQMLRSGGRLYLSVPIGRARVEFNSQRVFAPQDPVVWANGRLDLERFDYVDDAGDLVRDAQPQDAGHAEYACGIYTFRKAGQAAAVLN